MISTASDTRDTCERVTGYPAPEPPATTAVRAGFRRILVATDASHAADGALRMTDLLAANEVGAVELLSVVNSIPSDQGPAAAALPSSEMLASLRSRMRAQLGMTLGDRPLWKLSTELGSVAETICRAADRQEAELIVLGLGSHRRRYDRALGDATALKVSRGASTPVLIAPASAEHLPSNVMICMDFTRASIHAARSALRIVRAPAVVRLVHVHADDDALSGKPIQSDEAYRAGLDGLFEALERGLGRPCGVSFQRVVIPVGDPASELLTYASANAIDLLVAGTHGKAAHGNPRLGSVSTRLIRSAQCAVLVSGWRSDAELPISEIPEVLAVPAETIP